MARGGREGVCLRFIVVTGGDRGPSLSMSTAFGTMIMSSQVLLKNIYIYIYIYIYVYLTVPGLSCGTEALQASLQHVNSRLWHVGSLILAETYDLLVATCGV